MQGIFQKENTDKALKYGIYRHLPTYEKIIRNLISFLAEKMQLSNFKIVNDSGIRIYEQGVTTQKISRELMANDVEIASISQHTETLEDYFLKITSEVGKSC